VMLLYILLNDELYAFILSWSMSLWGFKGLVDIEKCSPFLK